MLSAGHARALLALDDAPAQERLAQRVVAEGLSVRAAEELVALGETGPNRSPSAEPGRAGPQADELAERLSDRLDTRVRVEMGRTKGRIIIEFATADDLDRIVGLIVRRSKVSLIDKSTIARSRSVAAGSRRSAGELGPDVPGGGAFGDEGQERHRAGEGDQEQPPPGPAGATAEVDGGDQQEHVEPAVGDGGPGARPGRRWPRYFSGSPTQTSTTSRVPTT